MAVLFADLITILGCSLCMLLCAVQILRGRFSSLHVCAVVFYVMQVFPLFIEACCGVSPLIEDFPMMHAAMTDVPTAFIYDEICIVAMALMLLVGNRFMLRRVAARSLFSGLEKAVSFPTVRFVLAILSFLPVFFALLAPDPLLYLHFAPFYEQGLQLPEGAAAFHRTLIVPSTYIAFGAIVIRYLSESKANTMQNVSNALAIALYSWIDGKRALLMFSLVAILAIDIVREKYAKEPIVFLLKAALFGVMAVGYFQLYAMVSGKGEDLPWLYQYEMYYSRLNCVKTSIYAALQGLQVVEYPGQTLLYNLFFFVPRFLWPSKPYLFCKYFTAFSISGICTAFVPWNMLVNLWTEMISNFGLLGIALSCALIVSIGYLTDTANNALTFLLGVIFLCFYSMFGFETLTIMSCLGWLVTLFASRVAANHGGSRNGSKSPRL